MTDGTTKVFEARYRPGLGAKYATGAWIMSAVILLVGVFATVVAFQSNPNPWVIVVCVIIFGFLLILTIPTAVGSRQKWGADDRLALRVDAAGVTLGRVGLLAWGEITAIRVTDTGGLHGNVARRAFEVVSGSSTHRFVTVWVRDADAVVAHTQRRAQAARNLLALDGHYGFDGVWGQGLDAASWESAADTLVVEGSAHGIPVHGRNNQRT